MDLMTRKINDVSENQSEIKTELSAAKTSLENPAKKQTPEYFTASLSSTFTSVGTVPFKNIIDIAAGSGYNKNTGVYTAPTDGLYFFSLYILKKRDSNYVQTSIHHDSKQIAYCHDNNYGGTYSSRHPGFRNVACSATVFMRKGETIYVKNASSSSGLHPGAYTGLTGFRVLET